MWDVDAIEALTEEFGSFEVLVANDTECNALINILQGIGVDCDDGMFAEDGYVPYPYFHIHNGMWLGGNSRRAHTDRPLFTYEQFVSAFNLSHCSDDYITNMDSVL